MAIFDSDLQNPNTKYFILDNGRIEYRDIDFEIYSWNKNQFNLVKSGDLFIYRKPHMFNIFCDRGMIPLNILFPEG